MEAACMLLPAVIDCSTYLNNPARTSGTSSSSANRMLVFFPYADQSSDYNHIRANGMWYQEWQSGYTDILKRGYPRPKHKTTVLAELCSPITPDFLHGGDGDVPFL